MRTPERPSLAYVVNSLNPGGTEKLVVDMSRAFAAEYRLEVFCLDEPGQWAADLRGLGVPVHGLWRQPGLDPGMPMQLARHFRRMRAAIVHAHQCTAWFYAALARLRYPRPRLLLEEHGRFYPEVDSRKRRLVNANLIAPLTDRIVAVSRDVAGRLARYEGLAAERIEVVYNGVQPAVPLNVDARAVLRQELGFMPDDIVVGTVGRFDPVKNLPLLVASIARARAAVPRLRGLLVGDGPVAADVRALVDGLGLAGQIHFTGFREDARSLVQCLDLFVLSSLSEGTSMALLEAMAAGVPVAVTAVGGNVEVVVDGESGWVVPSDDVTALTAALVAAAGDSAERARRGLAARRRFADRFSFDAMIGAYRQIYGALLGSVAQPARAA